MISYYLSNLYNIAGTNTVLISLISIFNVEAIWLTSDNLKSLNYIIYLLI